VTGSRREGCCEECGERFRVLRDTRASKRFCSDRCKSRARYRRNPEPVRERTRAYYWAHRDELLAKAKLKRAASRPAQGRCSECGEPLVGQPHRVVCSRRCKDAKYRRLHPEANKLKLRRRRARRKQAAAGA
jgi:endogenous inhibitor of DNA gyrase (YacG/DUF329 family)